MSFRTGLLATIALLAAAGPAQAALPSQAKFVGTITATQATTWNEPRHTTFVDCFHNGWEQGSGTDTWTVKGRPTKVLVSRVGTGSSVSLHYGNFNPHADGPMGIRATVTRERSAQRSEGSDPGECGGIGTVVPQPDDDCGTRTFDSHVGLDHRDGKITPYVGMSLSLTKEDDFHDCHVTISPEVTDNAFADVSTAIPGRDLLDPRQGLHVVLGTKTFRHRVDLPHNGEITTTTTVKWQLRLKRVK